MEQVMEFRSGITAVIPAYNEANNIGSVLAVLQDVDALSQIIVVNDGSNDGTSSTVKQAATRDERLFLLTLPWNQGKGKALLTGAKASNHDILLFLDADLKGIRPSHIKKLIQPVQQKECGMSVGLFADGHWTTSLTHHLFPFLSGQRCLNWPLFQDLYREKINGWSIETALSLHAHVKKLGVSYVMWPGATHALRPEKRATLAGYWSHVKMWWEIGSYTYQFLLHQARISESDTQKGKQLSHLTIIK